MPVGEGSRGAGGGIWGGGIDSEIESEAGCRFDGSVGLEGRLQIDDCKMQIANWKVSRRVNEGIETIELRSLADAAGYKWFLADAAGYERWF